MNLLCVIVLYKTSLGESKAFNTFIRNSVEREEMGLFVYDNSPVPLHSEKELGKLGIKYVSDITNSGISKAYNEGADYGVKNGYDWILFSDQDTCFPNSNYAIECKKILIDYPSISLIIPIVETPKGILSPLFCKHHIPIKFNYRIGEINNIKNSAIINSGMAVRLDSFIKAGGYNENVPLDYSDYQFIDRLRTIVNDFYLMNYRLTQSFSNDVDSDEALLRRFKSITKSIRNYEGSLFTQIDLRIILIKRCLSLTIRKKSLKFVKILLFS